MSVRLIARAHHSFVPLAVVTALVAATIAAAQQTGQPAVASQTGGLPRTITAIMDKPRYAHATWNLLATDVRTGDTIYQLNPDRLAFTGSVRKLFSVGLALNALGAKHRFTTPVYRQGQVNSRGTLTGDLDLVAAGDLTFGGRQTKSGGIAYTDFDHNDANNLGTAILTPQNPLRALNELARQVRASGIRAVTGDVVIDDRLFDSYRVPNGNLLITPIMVNENMVDVTVTPTEPGKPARIDWRPKTPAFRVVGTVKTTAPGTPADISLSNGGLMKCTWATTCTGTVSGTIPVGYRAPLSGSRTFVHTFRVEDPSSFARIAFVQALRRAGVDVRSRTVAPNAPERLPARGSYRMSNRVAAFVSPPYSEQAKLILKVSLNLGANLSLSLFGLTKGVRTIAGSLAAERQTLIGRYGIRGSEFTFPTNGSGSPDSQAAPRATVDMLIAMTHRGVFPAYHAALPVLGVNGSLADVGKTLPAKGHVFAKTGTTVTNGALEAQVLAGYITARSGRRIAFALYVNHVGPLQSISDVLKVLEDEAKIANVIYRAN